MPALARLGEGAGLQGRELSRDALKYVKRKGSLPARFTVTSGTLRSSDVTRLRAPRR